MGPSPSRKCWLHIEKKKSNVTYQGVQVLPGLIVSIVVESKSWSTVLSFLRHWDTISTAVITSFYKTSP